MLERSKLEVKVTCPNILSNPVMKIAVVGSGVSGLAATWVRA
jgi:hypothetical protein